MVADNHKAKVSAQYSLRELMSEFGYVLIAALKDYAFNIKSNKVSALGGSHRVLAKIIKVRMK